MTEKVHTLRPDLMTSPVEPVEGVVSLLEEMLAKAKSGELRAVAIAGIKGNGHGISSWKHENQYFALIGAVSWLHSRLHTDNT